MREEGCNIKKIVGFIILAIILGVIMATLSGLKAHGKWFFAKNETNAPKVTDASVNVLVIKPDVINPLVSKNKYIKDVSNLIFEGLTKLDGNLCAQNSLAKIVEGQDENKVYKVVLKNGVKFHNGEELTTDDVIFTIKKIQELGENSIYYFNLQNIESVNKISATELKISLKELDNFLPEKLTFPIISEEYYSGKDLYKETGLVGTGVYKLEKMTNTNWTLIYNKDYREKPRGNIKTVNVKIFDEGVHGFEELKSGDVDIADTNIEVGAYGRSAFSSKRYDTGIFKAIMFNMDNEKLGASEIRQAILLGINIDSIIEEYLNGYGRAVSIPINPSSYLYNSSLATYSYNPEKAQDILNNADWKLINNLRMKNGEALYLNLLINQDKDYEVNIAESIKNNLANLGIAVTVISKSSEEYMNELDSKNYDIALTEWALSPYPEFLYYFESDSKNNITGFSDKDYDYWVYMAKREIIDDKELECFKQMENILNAKLPIAGLYIKTSTVYYDKGMIGEFCSNVNNIYEGIENLIFNKGE